MTGPQPFEGRSPPACRYCDSGPGVDWGKGIG